MSYNRFDFKQHISIYMFSLLLLCVALIGYTQEEEPAYSLSSPYGAVITHLSFLQENNYHPDISARSFDQRSISKKEARSLAIKWKQVLDGEGIYVQVEDIPKKPNYLDSASGKQRYIITEKFPAVYLQKIGNRWLFPEQSFSAIKSAHKQVYPMGMDRLLNVMPKMGHAKFLGLHLWQHITILIILLISFILHKLLTFLFVRVIAGFIHRFGHKTLADQYIPKVARPLSLLLVFLFVAFTIKIVQLPIWINSWLIKAINAALPIFAALVFYNLVDVIGIYFQRMADRTESTLDDMLVPLIRKVLKVFVIIIGSLYFLSNLDVDIWPLITGLSIGGLAFALAAQDTIKNFFGSLMIFLDKPFQIGDWITSGDVDGTVEEVGFRSSRVRTFTNSLVYIPNGKLADAMIDNHGLRIYRRFYTKISITYDTPPHLIELFVEGLNRIVADHPHTRKDAYHIYLNDMADSALHIMFYIFFSAPDWGAELKYRHEVIISIIRLAESLHVRFAFPTQTLHLETLPGELSLTPSYSKTYDEMKLELDQHFEQKKATGKKKLS